MLLIDLGWMAYREAWRIQEEHHAQVLAGGEERLILVEHAPVITLGRRPGVIRSLIASEERLAQVGVELVQSDRGGDITFHGPGQVVAYPIIRLADHGLSAGGYVHKLERIVIDLLAELSIAAHADPSAVGVWVDSASPGPASPPRKVCAFGVRIRRGVSLHGLALNVTTDLRYFDLIVPCGLRDRGVTSLSLLLGERCPSFERVKEMMGERIMRAFPAR
jgi:lipoyl(octanoyl) transferase